MVTHQCLRAYSNNHYILDVRLICAADNEPRANHVIKPFSVHESDGVLKVEDSNLPSQIGHVGGQGLTSNGRRKSVVPDAR